MGKKVGVLMMGIGVDGGGVRKIGAMRKEREVGVRGWGGLRLRSRGEGDEIKKVEELGGGGGLGVRERGGEKSRRVGM